MKMKKLFAICCCALLLAGCESSAERSKPIESSKTESAVGQQTSSSTESETSISKSSTTSTESSLSSEKMVDYMVPTAYLDWESKTVDYTNNTLTVSFTTDVAFEPNVKYYLRVYHNAFPFGESDIVCDKPFDTSKRQITIDLDEGNNYIYVQFHTDEKEGETSNEIYQSLGDAQTITTTGGVEDSNTSSNVQRHTLTFYTMSAAMYGDAFENLAGYPDYSGVEYYLSQGIQPDYIDVDVYFTCLFCGTERFCATVTYSYNEGELNFIPDVYCTNKNCTAYKQLQDGKLFSRVE